jgi:hypothetical protein
MPKSKQPPQAQKIVEFAKEHSNSRDHADHYISTNVGPLLGRRVYCVEWGYDEDEDPQYWCYVASRLDNPSDFEYFDDETALFHSLATVSGEFDNNYRIERFRQIAELALDIFAGFIAASITIAVIVAVFMDKKDIGQMWNILAVIIGYYFGKTVVKRSDAKPAKR